MSAFLILSAISAAQQSIGAYMDVQAQKDSLESQASSLYSEARISDINASRADEEALFRFWAGSREVAKSGLEYAQVKSAAIAQTGASGVRVGTGSAAEVAASIEFAKETDKIALNLNAVRELNAGRGAALNFRLRGAEQRARAKDAQRVAKGMNPALAAFTSLTGSAARAAGSYATSRYAGSGRSETFANQNR